MDNFHYLNTIENLCVENGKLQAIIESSTNGIIEVDIKGNILSSNPAFYHMVNISPRDGVKYNLGKLLNSEDIEEALSTLAHGEEEILVKGFHVPVTHGGREVMHYLEIKFSCVPVMNDDFIIGIVKDKTDIMRALENREEYISTLLNMIHELKIDNRDSIYHIASLVELRDHTTGKHLERVESYTRKLAQEYMHNFGDRDERLTDSFVEDMAISSILHDIGKVAISDTILQKPDKLTSSEFESIKEHTIIAGEALKEYKGRKDFLAMGREIATYHHEKWDGTGYPTGKKGATIPLSARIVALCDTYDALVSERPYKDAYSHKKAIEIIKEESGISFDPDIVELFLKINDEFLKIRQFYDDDS
ncbi:HD domain-containing phosphohydrolase [Spirochaeta isovalerica]|uniref:PAS domain S-box-containing protein n=1 Tax=Spirochaeta isovalerica TaxID=150 RepID=A0A841RE23_9SPIO|nr:HD domain-containing phosphohydrolase [Spirochaeta isovalerica]MBB6481250.1 PAS domain S-box-containing protein [Spirochaeta isovalerica]